MYAGELDELIKRSNAILLQKDGLGWRPDHNQDGPLEFGTLPLCQESSDAVTRAAHSMGIMASREVLMRSKGWHCVTSFGVPEEEPSWDDLILCRTWGQYDEALYNGDHPQSGKPFFGTRAMLAELLPAASDMFTPHALMYRQVTHRPGKWLFGRHAWLEATPAQLAAGEYAMGLAQPGASVDGRWC